VGFEGVPLAFVLREPCVLNLFDRRPAMCRLSPAAPLDKHGRGDRRVEGDHGCTVSSWAIRSGSTGAVAKCGRCMESTIRGALNFRVSM